MHNTDLRIQLYLAALLHDIGKFYQRADEGVDTSTDYKSSKFLSPDTKKIVNLLCPVNKDKFVYDYVHVLWTYEFIKKDLNKGEDFAQLASLHHKPDTSYFSTDNIRGLAPFIQLADSMASGMDRTQRPAGEQDEYGMKTQPLYPIISHILLQNLLRKKSQNNDLINLYNSFKSFLLKYGYDLSPISIRNESIFPKENEQLNDLSNSYQQLWEKFEKEVNNLPNTNLKSFADTLFYLLKKYLWCMPASASRNDIPDISLFEHLKVTAAFTVCLYDYYQGNSKAFNWNSSDRFPLKIVDEKALPFLLFCGDLSGIQDYIYNIYSKEARKSLKGRSFYLELLTKTLVLHILDKLNLFLANEIYSSGGKFYLLLPNTEQIRNQLKQIELEIQQNLLNEKSGNLYVCMDYIEFGLHYQRDPQRGGNFQLVCSEKDVQENDIRDIGTLWRTLTDKTARKKFSKYLNVLSNDKDKDVYYNLLFSPQPGQYPAEMEVCAVTGEVAEKEQMKKLSDGIHVLHDVYKQTLLGDKLKDATHIIIAKKENTNNLYFDIEPLSLGWGIRIINENNPDDEKTLSWVSSLHNYSIHTINSTDDFLKTALQAHQCSYGFWFYGGNTGNDKTFEELCEADKDISFTRLGVLRMDVDGLGNIFKHGLEYKVTEENRLSPEELDAKNPQHYVDINRKKSFSAYATLSQQLNYFFCGYLNTIREKDEYKDHVQIVYSGGDDLFVAGKWDKVIDLAAEIREQFAKYTLSQSFIELLRSSNHAAQFMEYNDFGISAGIELINVKYPIQRGAEKAGDAEEQAKDFNNKQKNAITLLHVPLSWDTEWDYMNHWRNKILEALANGNLSKGLLRKIFNYYETIRANEQIKKNSQAGKPDLSWQWNMAYAFERNRKDENKHILDEIQKQFLCGTHFNNKRLNAERTQILITLAARLAELDYRAKQIKTIAI